MYDIKRMDFPLLEDVKDVEFHMVEEPKCVVIMVKVDTLLRNVTKSTTILQDTSFVITKLQLTTL